MKLSDIFSVAEWTNRVLLVSVYNVNIKLISYSVFTCATDDFQKSRKKVCRLKKMKCLMIFKMARPVCGRLHFNLIKHFTKKTFILKNAVSFAFLTKKRRRTRNFSKPPLNFVPCKCTNKGKQSFQYHQRILRKMRLKTFAYNFV